MTDRFPRCSARCRGFAQAMAISALVVFAPSRALADPTSEERAAARTLFEQARTLAHDGHVAEACPRFEESQRLDPGMGTLFNLADCYERIGKTASAWSAFLEVADAAKSAGQVERESLARKRAAGLEKGLARVALALAEADRGPSVHVALTFDGRAIGEGALGVAVPVDAGPHDVAASAPGRRSWTAHIEVAQRQQMTVDVPPLEVEAHVETAGPARAADEPLPERPTEPAPVTRTWQKPVAIAAGATGLVATAVGTFFGLQAKAQWATAEPHCHGQSCDPEGFDAWSSAHTSGTAATIAFSVGAVLVVTGVVLFLTAPGQRQLVGSGSAGRAPSFTAAGL